MSHVDGELRFTVPGPPVGYKRVGRGKFGGSYIPPEVREYMDLVDSCAFEAVEKAAWSFTPDDRFSVRFDVYRPVNRGDWDNYAKAAQDAMQGRVFHNDAHVLDGRVVIHFDKENPRLEVRVRRLGS